MEHRDLQGICHEPLRAALTHSGIRRIVCDPEIPTGMTTHMFSDADALGLPAMDLQTNDSLSEPRRIDENFAAV